MELFDLSNEVVVVIGGTGALGGAIATGLARAGAKVAVVGRNSERGNTAVQKIREEGGVAEFFKADAVQSTHLKQAHETILAALGEPGVLVNAAGGTDPESMVTSERGLEGIPLTAWRNNFDLNLVGGVLLPCQEFGPAMVERGHGSIINIASVSGHVPLSRVVAYSAAKAAVLSLTQFLGREWGRSGVRVNSITPGFFPAVQNRRLLFQEDGKPTPRAEAILSHTPMARFGEPHELVGAAIFLASEAASGFVTGTDICVDGGFLCQTI